MLALETFFGPCHIGVMDGKQLRIWRKGQGLTQQELAERLGVARPTVNRWEAGVQPMPEKMVALSLETVERRLAGE